MEFSDIWGIKTAESSSGAPQCNFCGSEQLIDLDGETGQCNSCGLTDCPTCENQGGCPSCEGSIQTCQRCGGHGRLPLRRDGQWVEPETLEDIPQGPECDECEGTGKATCWDCDGEGVCTSCERPTLIQGPIVIDVKRSPRALPDNTQ